MKIKVTLNGKEVWATRGETILQAAKKNGVEIPTLCYHSALPPFGACRVCLVEVKSEKNLVASCAYPIEGELAISTESERVKRARRTVLDLLLSDHPYDCMTCEKSGNCLLEKYAYDYGIKKPLFEGERRKLPVKDGRPFLVRDLEKCILCGRCVEVCGNVVGANALDFAFRGSATTIVSGFDQPLKDGGCVFCGNCIEVCPVGALRELEAEGQGRIWELAKVKTICPYCGVGCNLEVQAKDNRIVKIGSWLESPVNQGWLCVKGKFGFEYVGHPDRLKKPLKRSGPRGEASAGFTEIEWEEALNLIVRRFTEIKESSGSDGLAGLSSAKCTNEENYLFQKFVRVVFGTNNIDHCARLCHAPSVTALAQTLGSGAMTNSLDEIENVSDCILLTGSNVTESQPVTSYRIRKAVSRGARLLVIDPKRIDLSDIAEIYLQPRIGTDVMLFNGLAKIVLKEGLVNKEFIAERVENFEEYQAFAEKVSLSEVERVTGISVEDLKKVAQLYSRARASVIVWAMGITQHISGTDNVFAISNLALLTGQIGRPGAGLCPLRGQNNVQGACDMGCLPDSLPGYQKVSNPQTRKRFEELWAAEHLPEKPGLTVTEIFEAVHQGRVKGLYIMGENPLISDPDTNHLKEALQEIQFLVVQDIFLSETGQYADIVLPAASSFEKEGAFTNTERRVQKVSKCVEPPGEAKPDWEIIRNLAQKFGRNWNYRSAWEITGEINRVVPSYRGITPERIRKGEALQWPCPDETSPGTPTLHLSGFPIGKAKMVPVEYREPFELPDKDYPFVLTTGRILSEYHTRTMTGRSAGIKELTGEPFCLVNRQDARRLNLKDCQKIEVFSRRGRICLRARLSESISPGIISVPFHFAANLLTHHETDPKAKTPEYKVLAGNIRKVR